MMKQECSFGIIPLQKQEDGIIKVLLIFHKKGRHWGFPKGHKEGNETDLEAAKRELQEETGLFVEKILSEIPYVENYTFYKGPDKVFKTASYYLAFVQGSLHKQEEEVSDARWVSFQEALSLLTFTETKHICQKVFDLL